jgi:hypothetical protein
MYDMIYDLLEYNKVARIVAYIVFAPFIFLAALSITILLTVQHFLEER